MNGSINMNSQEIPIEGKLHTIFVVTVNNEDFDETQGKFNMLMSY